MTTTQTAPRRSNCQKLQSLCDTVNKRYAKGQNDDDQVSAMFKFSRSIKDAFVLIGYDDYNAITEEQKDDYIKNSFISLSEDDEAVYYNTYKGKIVINK